MGRWQRTVRSTGRCADGVQRDAGRRVHLVDPADGDWGRAACGQRPGRLSGGWVDVAGRVTCPRCWRRERSYCTG